MVYVQNKRDCSGKCGWIKTYHEWWASLQPTKGVYAELYDDNLLNIRWKKKKYVVKYEEGKKKSKLLRKLGNWSTLYWIT